jgi:hypothetical protein
MAVVLAICISENSPSCMRAPPEAVTQMKGTRCSIAACTPRTKRSPSTDPIEPPMKSNSKTASTTGKPFGSNRCMTTSASVSPVLGRILQALRITAAVLEVQRIDRQHLVTDLEAPLAIEQEIDPRPRVERM